MSDVQPFTEDRQTGLGSVIEHVPDPAPLPVAGPDGFKAPPSLLDTYRAGRRTARADRTDFDEIRLRDGYAPIVEALGLGASQNPAAFYDSEDLHNPILQPSDLLARQGGDFLSRMADRKTQERLIVEQIRAHRAADKNFLPGLPDTVDGLHAYFLDQEKAHRAAAGAVQQRARGFGAGVAGLAGSAVEAFHDPVNLITLPIGGGGKTVVQVIARETLVNGALEALQQPIVALNRDEMGEHLTLGEAVTNTVTAGVAGGLLEGAGHAAREFVPPALFNAMPEAVQRRWADRMKVGDVKLSDMLADVDNRELAAFSRSAIGPERMTPDETAAAATIEREQEIGEASPFVDGPEGDAAHNQGLAAALQRLIDGEHQAPSRTALLGGTAPVAAPPVRIAPVEHSAASVEAQFAAIVGNEGGVGAHGEFLTSPAGAIGPAQVMPGTAPEAARLAGVPFDAARYRADHAYNLQLGRAYYDEQLRVFGDPAMAAAAYNAGPGSAARGTGLRGAMRRAAEHGEPANWEAFLPAETRQYVADFRRRLGVGDNGAARAGGEGDDGAGFRAEADAAEAEALSLSERARDPDADLGRAAGEAAFEPVPVLKRDMFGSDAEWADAQLAVYHALNDGGETSPQAAGNGPPARAEGVEAVGQPAAAATRAAEAPTALDPAAIERRTVAAAIAATKARKPRARSGPQSLLEYLSEQGGIDDVGGDLTAMGADRWHRGAPFRRKLIRARSGGSASAALPGFGGGGGATRGLDHAFDAAIDAGFFPQFGKLRLLEGGTYDDLPDMNVFLEAIDEELRGRPLYTPEDTAQVIDRAREHYADGELLDRLGSVAEDRGLELDGDMLDHALAAVDRGTELDQAVDEAVIAAAMRDLDEAVEATGKVEYGQSDTGRSWEDEVNHDGAADPDANVRPPDHGGGRSEAAAGDAAAGGTLAAQRQGAAENPDQLSAPARFDAPELERFSDPDGDGAKLQAQSLEHDLRAGLDRAAAVAEAVGQPAADRAVEGEVVGLPTTSELWRLSQDELIALRDELRLSDKQKMVRALGEAGAKRFDALDRAANSSYDIERAEEASRLLEKEFGTLTPEQERLIYGIGEVDASVDEIDQLVKAHSDVLPGDDAGWSAYMGASAIRDATPAEIAAVVRNEGSVRAQAAFVRMRQAMRNLAASGVPEADAPAHMARALVDQGGWRPEQASEIVQSFVDATREMATVGPKSPPVQLLEHDTKATLDRGAAVDPAIAARQRREVELRAGSPLRPGDVDADGTIGLGLFDAADQPKFRLTEDAEPRTLGEILDELDDDDRANAALRGCLNPGGAR